MSAKSPFSDFSAGRAAEIKRGAMRGFSSGTSMGATHKARFETQRAAAAPRIHVPTGPLSPHAGPVPGGAAGGSARGGGTTSLALLAAGALVCPGLLAPLCLSVHARTQSLWMAGILGLTGIAIVSAAVRMRAIRRGMTLLGWALLLSGAVPVLVRSGLAGQGLIDAYRPVAAGATNLAIWYLALVGYAA